MQILIGFLYFLIEVAVVCFIGWLMVALMGIIPFIPENIKAIIKQVIYFIVAIVCLVLLIGWLVSFIGGAGIPWPPIFHR